MKDFIKPLIKGFFYIGEVYGTIRQNYKKYYESIIIIMKSYKIIILFIL